MLKYILEALSDYYAIHIQVCINSSVHVADNNYCYNDCFITCTVYLQMIQVYIIILCAIIR